MSDKVAVILLRGIRRMEPAKPGDTEPVRVEYPAGTELEISAEELAAAQPGVYLLREVAEKAISAAADQALRAAAEDRAVKLERIRANKARVDAERKLAAKFMREHETRAAAAAARKVQAEQKLQAISQARGDS